MYLGPKRTRIFQPYSLKKISSTFFRNLTVLTIGAFLVYSLRIVFLTYSLEIFLHTQREYRDRRRFKFGGTILLTGPAIVDLEICTIVITGHHISLIMLVSAISLVSMLLFLNSSNEMFVSENIN